MRIWYTGLLAVALVTLALKGAVRGDQDAATIGAVPQLPYKMTEWPPQLTSAAGFLAPWNLIQVSSVAVTPRGTVLVLHRGAQPVLEFQSNGKYIRSWVAPVFSEGKVAGIPKNNWAPDRSRYSAVYGPAGCDSCGAHSVRVDPQGNIWFVDATAHMIYKTNMDGQELMRVGTKGVAGASQTTFNLPTDVAFASNGDFYVSDGYGGNRVVKFSKDGKYLLEWGKRGDGPGQFRLPHNLVVDPQGRVYVTDRDNQRIEVFDGDGKFLAEWKNTGGVSGLAMARDGRSIWTGAILRDLNGKAIGALPTRESPHGVAVGDAGDIYLGQLSGVVQKLSKQ